MVVSFGDERYLEKVEPEGTLELALITKVTDGVVLALDRTANAPDENVAEFDLAA